MKRIHVTCLFLFLAAFGLSACQGDTGTGKNPDVKKNPDPRTEPPKKVVLIKPPQFNDHWTKTAPQTGEKGELKAQYGRKALRMSVDQLRRSIPKLFYGLTWSYKTSAGEVRNWFDIYARTLGEADYLQLTQTTREATPLFMKFMDDMAGHVCYYGIAADLKQDDEKKRSVIRFRDGENYKVDQNLRFLRLKFHAIFVSPQSTKEIAHLRKLYDATLAQTKSASKAWQNVCVALLTAPEFFAY